MKKSKRTDKRKPTRTSRVRLPLAEKLDELAERRSTSFAEEHNRAVRELLEREGLWSSK